MHINILGILDIHTKILKNLYMRQGSKYYYLSLMDLIDCRPSLGDQMESLQL